MTARRNTHRGAASSDGSLMAELGQMSKEKRLAEGLELHPGERHAGMYAHESRSRVTSIEWITIHVPSEVRVMTYSF